MRRIPFLGLPVKAGVFDFNNPYTFCRHNETPINFLEDFFMRNHTHFLALAISFCGLVLLISPQVQACALPAPTPCKPGEITPSYPTGTCKSQPCDTLGETTMDGDRNNLVACLRTNADAQPDCLDHGCTWRTMSLSQIPVPTCVARYSTSSTKVSCGFTSIAFCQADEYVQSGGMYGGGNDALQTSMPKLDVTGKLTGWEIAAFDISGSGPCTDTVAAGTTRYGTPAAPPKFSPMQGAAVVVCCK
jgi:hypothetical protein